jgi:hypothetical protein
MDEATILKEALAEPRVKIYRMVDSSLVSKKPEQNNKPTA